VNDYNAALLDFNFNNKFFMNLIINSAV